MSPRISLVTPTFNQAGTIRETIDSVLGQDYRDIEYHVIDADSKDGTVEILRSYEGDSRFHWISEPDRGQSDAINKGLARSTGDIFNWINSDDYFEPGALRIVADAFEKNPQLDIVSGRTAEFRGHPPEIFNHTRLQLRANPETSITVGVYCQPSTFYRTEIFRALGVDEALHCVMDWHLWIRYLARYGQDKVLVIEPLLAHYRHHPAAKTSAASDRFYAEAAAIFHEILEVTEAPKDLLELDARSSPPPRATSLPFILGPDFSREKYFAAYAERMVRVYRRKNPAKAKTWLKQAQKYGMTWWRLKMALRLMFR